jgi:hypothetical protein
MNLHDLPISANIDLSDWYMPQYVRARRLHYYPIRISREAPESVWAPSAYDRERRDRRSNNYLRLNRDTTIGPAMALCGRGPDWEIGHNSRQRWTPNCQGCARAAVRLYGAVPPRRDIIFR